LGQYIFLKNFNNDGLDEFARLKSPTLGVNNKDKCFEFFYYLNGANTLNVYKFYPYTMKTVLAWTLDGVVSQDSNWLRATIPFTAGEQVHFILEGVIMIPNLKRITIPKNKLKTNLFYKGNVKPNLNG
jgi:hypothetical protein